MLRLPRLSIENQLVRFRTSSAFRLSDGLPRLLSTIPSCNADTEPPASALVGSFGRPPSIQRDVPGTRRNGAAFHLIFDCERRGYTVHRSELRLHTLIDVTAAVRSRKPDDQPVRVASGTPSLRRSHGRRRDLRDARRAVRRVTGSQRSWHSRHKTRDSPFAAPLPRGSAFPARPRRYRLICYRKRSPICRCPRQTDLPKLLGVG